MAWLRKIKAGLAKYDVDTFVGHNGQMFFDIETGSLRLSDGSTPGGIHVSTGGGGGTDTNIDGGSPGSIYSLNNIDGGSP